MCFVCACVCVFFLLEVCQVPSGKILCIYLPGLMGLALFTNAYDRVRAYLHKHSKCTPSALNKLHFARNCRTCRSTTIPSLWIYESIFPISFWKTLHWMREGSSSRPWMMGGLCAAELGDSACSGWWGMRLSSWMLLLERHGLPVTRRGVEYKALSWHTVPDHSLPGGLHLLPVFLL